uniref:MARVEL domain-containing protein n=1 Tax=Panagrolaimus sp. ES5 TaxID=591445 RepID=A0AC34F1C3_9BILA
MSGGGIIPPRRSETYTTQEPDGTFVTHTTTVREKYKEDNVLAIGGGKINDRYCCSPEGILRIAEIIIGLVIVSLITSVFGPGPFKGILFGQTIILIFTGIAFCFTFMLLVGYFFNLHRTHLDFFPWRVFDIFFSIICAIFFFIFCILEAYYSTGAWSNNCNDIGGDGFIHNGCRMIYEWAFAAFFCFLLCILYAASAFLARKKRNFDDDFE